jgi:hypothetical protein
MWEWSWPDNNTIQQYNVQHNKSSHFYIVKEEEVPVPDSEIETWESFGTTKPIILSKPDVSNTSHLIFVPYMIDMGFSGGSMLLLVEAPCTEGGGIITARAKFSREC